MEVNFFFQESFFSVIQAKVVQFFTYWNQKIFFGKIKIFFFEIIFLNLHVPGYTKIQKNNFKNIFFDLSEKKFLVPICKKLNNFCLDDGKKRFLEKKIYFHKHVLLDDVFFSTKEGGRWRNFSLIFLEST